MRPLFPAVPHAQPTYLKAEGGLMTGGFSAAYRTAMFPCQLRDTQYLFESTCRMVSTALVRTSNPMKTVRCCNCRIYNRLYGSSVPAGLAIS